MKKETANKKADKKKFAKRMLNFDELAEYIGLSPQTIRNKFYAGEFPIPAKKIYPKPFGISRT